MSGMVFFGRMMFSLLAAAGLAGLSGCSLSDSGQLDEENEPHYLIGKSRVNALDSVGAVEAFDESLQVNPHSAAAHYQLACLFDSKRVEVADPAAAIYHYQEYLKLKPQANNVKIITDRIQACKRSLAEGVGALPSMPAAQRQLEQLLATNRVLQAEVNQWRAYYANQPAPMAKPETPASPTPVIQNNDLNPPPKTESSPPTANLPSAAKTKTHLVARGESLAIIARKAHVSLAALQAANPGINPKKLRVGQAINLPTP